jgi:hypothetical protein
MTIRIRIRAAFAVMVVALGTIPSTNSLAYVANGVTWNVPVVQYQLNPANLDLPTSSVESAIRYGAETWHQQSGASIQFSFAGRSSATATTYDGVNLVVFRNASSGSAIATTYWWSSGSRILDADIVFWDEAFRFFAGTNGCSSGFYIEDIAAHEFGHALGLGHSQSTNATMYFSTSSCSTRNRTLDADDIAGVRALYPPSPVPRPPAGLRFMS